MKPHDLGDLEHELSVLVRRYERVRLSADPESVQGLERAAYMVLGTLDDHGPLRSVDLARVLGLDKTTVSRHVSHLEQRDLIERVADPDDGRASLLGLSPEGRRRYRNHRATRRAALEEQLADWSATDRRAFVRLLQRYNDAMEQRFGVAAANARTAQAR